MALIPDVGEAGVGGTFEDVLAFDVDAFGVLVG